MPRCWASSCVNDKPLESPREPLSKAKKMALQVSPAHHARGRSFALAIYQSGRNCVSPGENLIGRRQELPRGPYTTMFGQQLAQGGTQRKDHDDPGPSKHPVHSKFQVAL